MDQSTISVALGIGGALLSSAFLLLAIFECREARLDARLQQCPESPLKGNGRPRRAEDHAPAKLASEGRQPQRPQDPSASVSRPLKVGTPGW